MPVIIDNDYVTLFYHDDKKMVHHIYKADIHGDYLKEALTVGTDQLIKYGAIKWLSDNRATEGHSDEEQAWIDTVWLPRTLKAGWKYWALVLPQNVIGQMNMLHYINSFSERGVLVRVFNNPDEAMTWLEHVDQNEP